MGSKRKKLILVSMLAFGILLFGAVASAQGLDGVVVNVNNEHMVVVGLGAYAGAFSQGPGNALYDFLRGEAGSPNVSAVRSGEKYMGLGAYAGQFSQDPANAVENTPAQDSALVATYKLFGGFDGEGNAILTPIAPTGPTASDFLLGDVTPTVVGNVITFAVDPATTYDGGSVTISHNARVTVSSDTRTRTALVDAGTIVGADAIDIFSPAQDAVTGQQLIDEGEITVTLASVDENNEDIPGQITVYTVNFVPAE